MRRLFGESAEHPWSRFGFSGAILGAPLCILAGTACNATTSQAKTPSDALLQLADEGVALYSFRLTGPLPSGANAHIALVGETASQACASYSTGMQNGDEWLIDIDLGDVAQGTYVVAAGTTAVGSQSMTANVALLHRRSGEYVTNLSAISGSITLDADASPSGAASGRSLALDIDVHISAVQQLGCQGGESIDGSDFETTCSCIDSHGAASTCTPEGGLGAYCCDGGGDQIFAFQGHLVASPCAAMCRVVAGLPDYCASIFGA